MNFSKYLLVIFSFLIFHCLVSYSQIRISIPDTVIYRGIANKIRLPVRGTININPLDRIKILFVYNSTVIDVPQAYGEPTFAMRSLLPRVNSDLSKLDSAKIEVNDTNVQNISDGIICWLEIEGLAGPDSITELDVYQVEINGSIYTNIEKDSALIKVLGIPIYKIFLEGMGVISPNPFSAITVINFFVKDKSSVRFVVYSIDGRLMEDTWDSQSNAKIDFYEEDGTRIDVYPDYIFDKGEYQIKIEPASWEFPAGAYYIMMQTDNGFYFNNFIYWK